MDLTINVLGDQSEWRKRVYFLQSNDVGVSLSDSDKQRLVAVGIFEVLVGAMFHQQAHLGGMTWNGQTR